MKIYDITIYGAEAGRKELQTSKIQKAIDDCFLNGGGEVQIPEGVFYTGDIRLRTGVTLHLLENACLLGSRNPEDYFHYLQDTVEPLAKEEITDAPYIHLSTIHGETAYEENKTEYRFKRIPGSRWNNGLIRAIHAENIAIIGEEGSVIDGDNCFDPVGEELYRGPHGIAFFDCKNIVCRGYTIQNTGNWAHHMLFCDDVVVRDICVLAGHDGIDVNVCNRIVIADSEFYTGDDCIAGFGNQDVLVTNCILNSSCSAFRFGGMCVKIENSKIYGPGKYGFRGSLSKEEKEAGIMANAVQTRNNMLSAFTYYADYSVPIPYQPGDIVLENCEIKNADRFLHYNYSGNETWQKHRPLSDITFRNIKAEGVSMPLTLYGDKDIPATLTMENVSLSMREGYEDVDLMHACHFDEITLKNVTISNGSARIKTWSDGNITTENTDVVVEKATDAFFAGAI